MGPGGLSCMRPKNMVIVEFVCDNELQNGVTVTAVFKIVHNPLPAAQKQLAPLPGPLVPLTAALLLLTVTLFELRLARSRWTWVTVRLALYFLSSFPSVLKTAYDMNRCSH